MLFFFTATVLLVSAQAKFYQDCGSKLGTVHAVTISKCAEDEKVCVLKRNSNVTFTIDFTPSVDVSTVHMVIHGIVMNIPCPFPMPQPDACKDRGLICPLKANKKASYRATMPVLKSYPKVKVDVKLELQNSDEEDLACVLITAKIQ